MTAPAAGQHALREAAQELIDARDACAAMMDADDPATAPRIERVQKAWQGLRAALTRPPAGAEPVAWRHVKTGVVYEILHQHATLEWEPASTMVVYRRAHLAAPTATIWIRPHAEFFDGRFEPVDAHPSPTPSGERTPKDYAIEHAGYLATAAERFADAANHNLMPYVEGEEPPEDLQEAYSDSHRALRSAIYEFRKRRDRAIAGEAAGTGEPR